MVAAVRSSPFASASARRALLALTCLLAFALQSFVAQTHIHPLLHAPQSVTGAHGIPAPLKNKTSQDDLSCPACQAAALVGLGIGPTGLLLFLPGVSRSVAPLVQQLLAIPQSPAHVWRSRGPPRA